MEQLPIYTTVLFVLTTGLTVFFAYKAANNSKKFLIIVLAWLAVQAILGLAGFFKVTNTLPPRFALTIVPPVLLIAGIFMTKKGKDFIDQMDQRFLTLLHVIRIPIELLLLILFFNKAVPQLMTFEGRNYDIISGISAVVVYVIMFRLKRYNRNVLLAWNFICLGLLVNIVAIAILSAPFRFQQLAFDQPNIALLYFPFNWLPAVIVPLVLFAHLASIRQLVMEKSMKEVISF